MPMPHSVGNSHGERTGHRQTGIRPPPRVPVGVETRPARRWISPSPYVPESARPRAARDRSGSGRGTGCRLRGHVRRPARASPAAAVPPPERLDGYSVDRHFARWQRLEPIDFCCADLRIRIECPQRFNTVVKHHKFVAPRPSEWWTIFGTNLVSRSAGMTDGDGHLKRVEIAAGTDQLS